MHKTTIVLAMLLPVTLGWQRRDPQAYLRLKEEAMILEYSVTGNEAVVIVEAESEQGLEVVEVRGPDGRTALEIRSRGGEATSLSGFMVESRELSVAAVLDLFPEGTYELWARTPRGESAWGSAELSHWLPPAPVVVYPQEGAEDIPTDLVVAWVPDPKAAGYRVILEQNENDGLAVDLPAGRSTFQVPDGVLAPGTETQLEIVARGENGNRTLVEVNFTTW